MAAADVGFPIPPSGLDPFCPPEQNIVSSSDRRIQDIAVTLTEVDFFPGLYQACNLASRESVIGVKFLEKMMFQNEIIEKKSTLKKTTDVMNKLQKELSSVRNSELEVVDEAEQNKLREQIGILEEKIVKQNKKKETVELKLNSLNEKFATSATELDDMQARISERAVVVSEYARNMFETLGQLGSGETKLYEDEEGEFWLIMRHSVTEEHDVVCLSSPDSTEFLSEGSHATVYKIATIAERSLIIKVANQEEKDIDSVNKGYDKLKKMHDTHEGKLTRVLPPHIAKGDGAYISELYQDLTQLLGDGNFSMKQRLECVKQITEGLQQLSEAHIYQSDSKLENFLISKNGEDIQLYYADMDDAIQLPKEGVEADVVKRLTTTREYTSIQDFTDLSTALLEHNPEDYASAAKQHFVFSTAISCFTLLTGSSPFEIVEVTTEDDQKQSADAVSNGNPYAAIEENLSDEKAELLKSLPIAKGVVDLLIQALNVNPKERPTPETFCRDVLKLL